MNHKGIIGLAIALLVGGMASYIFVDRPMESLAGATGAHTERSCATITTTAVEIGNEVSVQLIATGTRAFVRLQQPVNATNTVSLAFNNDVAAVADTGIVFEIDETGSTTPSFIDFGLKTSFPYAGAVTGITDTASTTLFRIECNY